jgi:hypothetical protein
MEIKQFKRTKEKPQKPMTARDAIDCLGSTVYEHSCSLGDIVFIGGHSVIVECKGDFIEISYQDLLDCCENENGNKFRGWY